ncbi:hypothetical protein ACOMHN_015410 [Nucella lapillus]
MDDVSVDEVPLTSQSYPEQQHLRQGEARRPTQLILMFEGTDLVGIVSLLYGLLFHSAAPSHRDMAPCELSVRTLAITVSDCACRTTWQCSTSLCCSISATPPHRCSLPHPHLLLIQPPLQQTHPPTGAKLCAPCQLHRDKDARAADNRMSLTCRFPQEQWVAAEQYFKVAL